MPYSNYPATHVARFVPRASLAMGGVGLMVGGAAAAAKSIRQVKDAEISRETAVKNTINEAAGAGLATATATAAIGAVGATGIFSLIGVLAVATGTKYLWNAATSPEKLPAPAPEVPRSAGKKEAGGKPKK